MHFSHRSPVVNPEQAPHVKSAGVSEGVDRVVVVVDSGVVVVVDSVPI